MTKKTQMALIRVVIKSEYKNQLLNLLSELNTVHVKSKKVKEKPHEVEEDRLFSEELEKYFIRAEIELENLITIKNCYSFLEKFNLTKDNILNFNHLTFKAFTTF